MADCEKSITAAAFITKHHLKAASSVSRAANFLLTNEYIIQVAAGFRLTDRFFTKWLKTLNF